MPNLTIEQKLVRRVPDAHPVPGHDLVVLRKVGADHLRLHAVLKPGDRLSFLDRLVLGANLVVYAVTRNEHLHTVIFTGSTGRDQGVAFALTLAFSVLEPRTLVENLESDPLGRLEKEVGEVLRGAAWHMDRATLRSPDVEEQLLSSPVTDQLGRRRSSLAFLEGFATELGLRLRGVQIERRFREEEAQQGLLIQEKLRRQGEIQRLSGISARATANLSRVLSQIADKVDSAPELRSAMSELAVIQSEIARILAAGERRLLLQDAEKPSGPLSILGMRGLGKELWREVDPAIHIRSERDSWDS